MNVSGKKLLILEEGLRDYNAHFYTWIKAIRKINIDAGAEVIIGGHNEINDKIREELSVLPTYSHNNWEGMYNFRDPLRRYFCVFLHNWRVYQQTKRILDKTGKVDCIELTAVRIHHLLGWRFLCKRFLGKRFDRVVMFLLTGEGYYDENQQIHFKKSSAFIRKVIQSYRPLVEDGNVCLAVDSHLTAQQYEKLTGMPFRLFPSPGITLKDRNQDQLKTGKDHVTFTTLGVSYFDKGINILQDAVLQFLKKFPDSKCRFVIQWAKETQAPDGTVIEINQLLRDAPQVTLIESILDSDEYQRYLHESDCLVLPYRRYVYYNRISGVSVEAACSGIPMIVTENTWLSWAMDKFGAGLTVKDGDAADLCGKFEEFVEKQREFCEFAWQQRQVAQEYNSSENYLRCLWERKLA